MTIGTGAGPGGFPRLVHVSERQGYETWSGAAMLVVALAVASPVLLGIVAPSVPRALWIALFVAFLGASITSVLPVGRRLALVCLGTAVALSWALVVTTPGMGLLAIILVVTVALSAYLVPVWAGLVLASANSLVLLLDAAAADGLGMETVLVVGFYLLIQSATLWSTHALIREQRLRLELAGAHVELRAATTVLAINERASERLRISRDLHDVLGHQLTVLALELEAARHRVQGPGAEHVERAGSVARDLLTQVRATVDQLRTEPTDLTAALEAVVAGLPGLDVSVDVAPDMGLDEQRTQALLLTVQEAVTNTLRHADASSMQISIQPSTADADEVVLTAVDDGNGARAHVVGNGLRGIDERLAALGGRVDTGSAPGERGFRLTARVPLA